MKMCTKCNIAKKESEFHKNGRGGLRTSCKVCHLEYKKDCYNKNKGNIKEKHKKYCKKYQKINRLKIKKYNREYKKSNKKYNKEYHKKYYLNNKKQNHANSAKRRALKIKATIKGYNIEITNIYKKCPDNFHVDHIIPLKNKSVCGLHVPWNLQYLSKEDNLKKSNSFDYTLNNNGWKL